MRVLIVDDDLSTIATLQAFLRAYGCEVAWATDGVEAFDLIQEGDYRIVISDWEMPGMDGPELCQRVRERQLGSYVYFILLTSRENESDLVTGLDAGADDFLRKPFNPDELRVRLRAANRISSLEARDVFIFSLAKLAESRDHATGEHLERMREYSFELASELGRCDTFENLIDADYIRTIYATSPLHDIGKVGIPDRILLKPGKLTAEEYEVMKTHTLIGAETLAAAVGDNPDSFYAFARDIVLTHHERYDGEGYPNGLRGEAIPLCGRIVAVADVYDALTTQRVYKPAYSHQKAKDIILENRGKAFDPKVVDAFVRCEERFLEIRKQLDEGKPLVSPDIITDRGPLITLTAAMP